MEKLPLIYLESLLALVAWREARGEPELGIKAVIHVILNRSKAGWGTVNHCIIAKNQFSSMTVHGDSELTAWPEDNDEIFLTCLNLAKAALENPDDDPSNGALYYENPAVARSQWFNDNVVAKMQVSATLGHHVFYKP